MDRQSLALPNDQDALIAAVAAVNPNTIVVLQTGGAVTMPWLGQVAAVLQMWLPGDGFGPAAARLLFGDAEPGGRLPVTFPADETQGPGRTRESYPGRKDARTGALDDVEFSEGLLVGYRWWDAMAQAPLFPFGHGLSYTTFALSADSVRTTAHGGALVDVTVRNTGTRRGSEVVQVYIGFPEAAGEPPAQLKGFAKVMLDPGETRRVQIQLDERAFQYWDQSRHAWTTAKGDYLLRIGRSSRDVFATAVRAADGSWGGIRH